MISENVRRVRERVGAAAGRAGRDPESVTVVAVSKGVPADTIALAAAAGIADVGENRAQELRDKHRVLGDAVTWHFVGSVQTNKVRYLDVVSMVHSLDRIEEADALQRRGEVTGRTWDVLIEMNVAEEASKQGIRPQELDRFLDDLGPRPLVRPRGLMVMAPVSRRPEDVRWVFAETRMLRDERAGRGLTELSMGMTDDFEVAVEEGSTVVRIGRAIFAPPRGTEPTGEGPWPGSGRKR